MSGGARIAVGPAPRSAGTNPAEHHPRERILVEAGGSATPSPRGRTGPGRAPPEGYRGGGRGWASGLRGPGPWWLWAGAGETGRAPGLRLVRGGRGRASLRAAGPAASWKRGLGAESGAGRVGSGRRPRWKRRHAGAGPVAAAGRRGRTGRWSAAARRAPLHGVGGRARGTRAAQAMLRGARVQGRRRAR